MTRLLKTCHCWSTCNRTIITKITKLVRCRGETTWFVAFRSSMRVVLFIEKPVSPTPPHLLLYKHASIRGWWCFKQVGYLAFRIFDYWYLSLKTNIWCRASRVTAMKYQIFEMCSRIMICTGQLSILFKFHQVVRAVIFIFNIFSISWNRQIEKNYQHSKN